MSKNPDRTLARILLILRDIYERQYTLYQQAMVAKDIDGIVEAQSSMLTCEEVAQELGIVIFTEEEKQEMDRRDYNA